MNSQRLRNSYFFARTGLSYFIIFQSSMVLSRIFISCICWLWVTVYILMFLCLTVSCSMSATFPTVSPSRLLMVSSKKRIWELIYAEIASIQTSFRMIFCHPLRLLISLGHLLSIIFASSSILSEVVLMRERLT